MLKIGEFARLLYHRNSVSLATRVARELAFLRDRSIHHGHSIGSFCWRNELLSD